MEQIIRRFFDFRGGSSAVGLLVLRLVVGGAMTLHGWAKIGSAGGMFHWMGDKLPAGWQGLAVAGEFAGGLGMMAGLLTPIAAFGVFCTMAVVLGMVSFPQHHAFVTSSAAPSYELPATYLAAALVVMLAGPGALSLDALLFGRAAMSRERPTLGSAD